MQQKEEKNAFIQFMNAEEVDDVIRQNSYQALFHSNQQTGADIKTDASVRKARPGEVAKYAEKVRRSGNVIIQRAGRIKRTEFAEDGAIGLIFPRVKHIDRRLSIETLEQVNKLKARADMIGVENLNNLASLLHEVADRLADNFASTETRSIGVNTHQALYILLSEGADDRGVSTSRQARQVFIEGLDLVDEKLDITSSGKVFDELEITYNQIGVHSKNKSKQWQLRIDKRTYSRALIMANEYGLSLSRLAALIIASRL